MWRWYCTMNIAAPVAYGSYVTTSASFCVTPFFML